MIKFPEFVKKFNKFKDENNIASNYNESKAYFWRFGQVVKDTYQPYLEQTLKDATAEEIQGFREMFEQGEDLLGHMVGPKLNKPITINFYKLNIVNISKQINNVLTTYTGQLLPSGTFMVTDPTDGTIIQPPLVIYPETLRFSGDFDGMDVLASPTTGTIIGEGFYDEYRSTNRNSNGIALSGSIDYHSTKIDIIRSDSRNDALIAEYEDFIQNHYTYYNGSGSGSSGYSGGSSGDDTGIVLPQTPLYRADYTIYFKRFDNPATLLWTLDIE